MSVPNGLGGDGNRGSGLEPWPAELLTAAQMRAVEAEAIASGAVTGLELMERAGAGVVEAIFAEWPELASPPVAASGGITALRRAVVLCGPGNNGGDGFVVARLLRERGWEVEVFLYGDAAKLPPDARVNYGRWREIGAVGTLGADGWNAEPGVALVVDALFGIGMDRPVQLDREPDGQGFPVPERSIGKTLREVADCFDAGGGIDGDERIRLGYPHVVAIDIPTGLSADTGEVLQPLGASTFQGARGWNVSADLTVAFHRLKVGHVLGSGPCLCGRVRVVDIGLGRARPASVVKLIQAPLSWLGKSQGHKFSYGHAVVISGPAGACGAARMTSRAALRVGAGLVTLACPPEAMAENAARLDAVMLRALAGEEALTALLSDPRINALCLGPGLGLEARAAGLVRVVLEATRGAPRATGAALEASRPGEDAKQKPGAAERLGQEAETGATGSTPERRDESRPTPEPVGRGSPRRALVLDADALTLISRDPDLFALLHEDCVLTPHGGEFARLFPDLAARMTEPATKGPAYSKVDATRAAATRAGCTVLYKGPDTVIASPGGTCAINAAAYDRAAPWLATAGSGDVLAGLITGLLARGFPPQSAAETGAWLHVEAARRFGPGLIAEDLPEMIPKVFRDLGL